MRRTLIALALVLALPTGTALAQTLGAVLTTSQEVPACSGSGFGNATITFDATRANINVAVTVSNLGSPITAAHIHGGAPGVQGNVELAFTTPFTGNTLNASFPISADLTNRMLQNPAGFYVNVHTAACPNGAARGQLSLVSNGGVVNYAAELRPQNEVPPTTGNAFGSALVTFDFNNNTITWEVTTNGIANATLSHIHRGSSAVSGPVVINFATSAAAIPGGRTKGSAAISAQQTANLTAADLTALQTAATANGYYVNVHSSAFPGGEIRGQLVPAKESDLAVAGKVGSFVTDVRVFNPSYDAAAAALLEYFPAGTAANTNATNTMVVSIPARGTATLNDVTGAAGLNAAAGIGGIRVSSASAINATSRIFSDQRAGGKGTFGQFLEGIPRAGALRRGVLPQLENDADFRTNLGFFNPNNSPVTVRLELRNEAGVLVASSVQTFNALAQQQNAIGTYFPGVDLTNQPKLTLSFDASAGMDVYAAINDNVSTDSYVVVAQEDTGVSVN